MLNRRALLLGASALVGAAGVAGPAIAIRAKWHSNPNPAVISWLKANALPIASVEPGTDFKDLEQLRPLIGDARIVSLGEATHGTRDPGCAHQRAGAQQQGPTIEHETLRHWGEGPRASRAPFVLCV